MRRIIFAVFLGGLSLAATPSLANLADGTCSANQKALVTTAHTTIIGGKTINYHASVGFLEVTAADNNSKACIFYTAYNVDDAGSTPRPITFAFNGGPGSASLWLHLGLMGPKHIDMGPDGLTAHQPFVLATNNESLLDVTDVVMIDPVATGFSATEGTASGAQFFGAKNDYKSVAAFIQNFLNANGRWDSPKFVLGESYGGVRGGLLAHHLQSSLGINLNGVIFISPMFSATALNFGEADNDIPYVTFLPSFATTAWYHKKAAPALQALAVGEVLSSAEVFARSRYAAALALGTDLPEAEFHAVAALLAQYTGLSQEKIEELNLRIADSDFFAELLATDEQVIGRFDSRFVGGRVPGDAGSIGDPSDAAMTGPFTAGINYYLRGELGLVTPSPYVTSGAVGSWPFDADGSEFSVVGDLSQALIDNTNLKIYVGSGYYDLACPYESVRYGLEHMAPHLQAKTRVVHDVYPSGHMIYTNPKALVELKANLAKFIAGAQ